MRASVSGMSMSFMRLKANDKSGLVVCKQGIDRRTDVLDHLEVVVVDPENWKVLSALVESRCNV